MRRSSKDIASMGAMPRTLHLTIRIKSIPTAWTLGKIGTAFLLG